MRVRFAIALSLLLLLTVLPSWAVSLNTVQLGARVDNIHFEKGTRIALVRVVNTSNKDISGLNLSMDVAYPQGQYHYERLLDFAAKIISQQKAGHEENGALHPNTAMEERLDLPIRGGNLPLAVTVKVDVVAYADSTADVENDAAFQRLVDLRRNHILAITKAAEIINEAAANSVTPDPRGMALTQLRVLLEQARRKQGEHELETELMVIIDDLEKRSPETSSADLRRYATDKVRDSEAMAPHTALRRSR
jgi:hypothetical protein